MSWDPDEGMLELPKIPEKRAQETLTAMAVSFLIAGVVYLTILFVSYRIMENSARESNDMGLAAACLAWIGVFAYMIKKHGWVEK